ncbi:MAG: PEP-CTERM sorting domain-containing protein [Limisphaerales bacterium]
MKLMIHVPFKNSAVTVTTLAMLMLGLVAVTQNISAQEMTAPQLASIVQSTANDTDMLLLNILEGEPTTAPSYSYNSTATDATWANWAGTLNGLYLGQTINLAYGNGSASAGTVSWDTTGTFGGGSVTGGGTSTISYPTSSTFDLTFNDTLTIGADSATADVVIPGTILGEGDYMFGSPGNEEAGSGSFLLDGVPVGGAWLASGWYSGHTNPDGSGWDDIRFWWGTIPTFWSAPTSTAPFVFTNTTIPEPSTLSLLSIGAVSLLARHWRRRTAQA